MKLKVVYMVADLENDVEDSIGDGFVKVWQLGSSLAVAFHSLSIDWNCLITAWSKLVKNFL